MSQTFCSTVSFASRCLRGFAVVLFLFSLIAAGAAPAKAGDKETADLAVDIFVKGAQVSGLPINPQEVEIVRQIVTCGVAGTPVGDCVRNMAVATAMKEINASPGMTEAATCVLDGKPPGTCGMQAFVSQLPEEAQPMANCMTSGKGNIVDCTKKLAVGMVIDKVPAEIRPAATCIIESGDAKGCATQLIVDQVVKNLPAGVQADAKKIADCLGTDQAVSCVAAAAVPDDSPVKPLVKCMVAPGANVGQCAATFASDNLPKGTPDAAKAVVACIGAGANFGDCAKNNAVIAGAKDLTNTLNPEQQKAIQAAFDTIDKLRPDAPPAMDAGIKSGNIATLQNIIGVAQGIRDKDWFKVSTSAGPELAIIASNILLSIFLTPALASALSPAVEAMIHNDVNAAKMALDRTAKGDAVGLAQVVFTWYETQFIDKPCALLGDNDVKDTICGGLSDAIKKISEAGGDVAKAVLGEGQKILEWLGVWGTVDDLATSTFNMAKDAVEKVAGFFGIGGDDKEEWKPAPECGAGNPAQAQSYAAGVLANTYLTCISTATDAIAKTGDVDTKLLDSACADALNKCVAKNNRSSVTSTCSAFAGKLRDLGRELGSGMQTAASTYTTMGGPAAYVNHLFKEAKNDEFGAASRDFCNPNFWDAGERQAFAKGCADFVGNQFPTPPDGQCRLSVTYSGVLVPHQSQSARNACLASLASSLATAAAKGESLVGPNSDYCKEQKAWIDAHPCQAVATGKSFMVPGGKDLQDITIKCTEHRITPPFGHGGASVLPGLSAGGWSGQRTNPGDAILNHGGLILNPGSSPGSGGGGIAGSGGNIMHSHVPDQVGLPQGGQGAGQAKGGDCADPRGCGGFNLINGNTNEGAQKTAPKANAGAQQRSTPKAKDSATQQRRKPRVAKRPPGRNGLPRPPSGNGGASGGNSAMERASGAISANTINSVSGSSPFTGAPSVQQPGASRRAPPGYGHGPVVSSRPGSSGGHGGYNTTKPIPGSSGGHGGYNTSKPIPSSPKTSPAPRVDDRIDYGGCSSCNKDDRLHVH